MGGGGGIVFSNKEMILKEYNLYIISINMNCSIPSVRGQAAQNILILEGIETPERGKFASWKFCYEGK